MTTATDGRRSDRGPRVLPAAVAIVAWAAAWGVASVLAVRRYLGGLGSATRYDLETFFLPAAEALARGESPYSVDGYVYSPLIALVLSPVAGTDSPEAVWTALQLVAAVVACLFGALAVTRGMLAPGRAGVFAVAVVTLLSSWTMTVEIWLGQVTVIVLAAVAIAMYGTAERIPGLAGAGLGIAALVKTWPAALVMWLLRSPRERRGAEWTAVGLAAAGAVALALAVAGPGGVVQMVSRPFVFSDQPLVSYSTWGAADLLFGTSGLAEPVVDSPLLRNTTALVLSTLVLALLVTALRMPGDGVIALANLTLCVILLLPVSHATYLLLALPVLWWWIARAFGSPRTVESLVVPAVLVIWWYLALRRVPSAALDTATDLPAFSIIFGSTLAAAIASVTGAARLGDSRGRGGCEERYGGRGRRAALRGGSRHE